MSMDGKQLRSCMKMVSYLTTLFLDKSLGGNLPVFSAHSFAYNLQLALLESAKEGKNHHKKIYRT